MLTACDQGPPLSHHTHKIAQIKKVLCVKLTVSSEIDRTAELPLFRLTPVDSIKQLRPVDYACGSIHHRSPVGTVGQVTRFRQPVHFPFGGAPLTAE